MSDKKYTPRETAIAVLKKAEELYRSSTLAKGEWKHIHDKLKREGYSEESADKIDGAIKAKMGKSEETPANPDQNPAAANPDEKADAALGEQVEQEVQAHEASNKDPEHHEKGSYKLAKFMGKMEMKKGSKSAPMDKADGQTLGAAIGYPGAAPTAPMPSPSPVMKNEKEAK
jgi:hypothetical protein